jgi:hypothetical protein
LTPPTETVAGLITLREPQLGRKSIDLVQNTLEQNYIIPPQNQRLTPQSWVSRWFLPEIDPVVNFPTATRSQIKTSENLLRG